MDLVNKILLESKDKNIFHPRRIDDRINQLPEPDKSMLTKYPKGTKIKVWIVTLDKFIVTEIVKPPEKNLLSEGWFTVGIMFITKNQIKDGIYGRWGRYLANYIFGIINYNAGSLVESLKIKEVVKVLDQLNFWMDGLSE